MILIDSIIQTVDKYDIDETPLEFRQWYCAGYRLLAISSCFLRNFATSLLKEPPPPCIV
jgi:hypothetical protein